MTLEDRIFELNAYAKGIAFGLYLRRGHVPAFLEKVIEASASVEAMCKFNPYHVPSGPDGGQFDFAPGGDSGDSSDIGSFPDVTDPDYREPGLGHPPVVEALAGLSAFGARTALGIAAGLADAVGASIRISRAAKSIEDYLGGPGTFNRNKAGDMYLMRGDKKIRFDINNSGNDEPHFQIEKETSSGSWRDAGPRHRYYFRKGK